MSISNAKRGCNRPAPSVPIPIKHAGRICGLYDASRRVHNRRWLDGHRVRKYNAIAYNVEVIDQLTDLGCEVLENSNPETGITYRLTLFDFLAMAIDIDLGHGPQLCVPLHQWRTVDGPEWPNIDDGVKAAPAWMQGGLFEVTA